MGDLIKGDFRKERRRDKEAYTLFVYKMRQHEKRRLRVAYGFILVGIICLLALPAIFSYLH